MVSALLNGRALTASERAFAARITPETASTGGGCALHEAPRVGCLFEREPS
jgi:hypothetical protein